MEKMTKSQKYEAIKEFLVANGGDQELIDLCDAEVAAIATKAEKAKIRAAEKRAEGDELTKAIAAVLTSDFQTAEQIVEQIEGEDLTKAKVVARMRGLIENGTAQKAQVDVNGRKVMCYALAGDAE